MDIHFNSYKVKYTMLDTLMNPVLRSHQIKSLNIFINLDDIFHKLHRPSVNTEFQMAGENSGKQMISNVLNVIAHYRQWGVRKGFQTRVIGVYTASFRGGFKNKLYVNNYRKKFCDINHELNSEYYFVNQGIRDGEKLFRLISQYIDKVYIIDSRFLEPSIIPYFISQTVFDASWNMIISRDPYDMQYAYKDRWSYIHPKGDKSIIVDKSNLWKCIANIEGIKIDPQAYEPSLYPLLCSVVGDVYRNIKRIKRVGWGTLFRILDRVMEYASDKSEATMQILLCQELVNKNTTMESITNNLNAIDIEAQVGRMGEVDKADILAQIIDVPDYDNLLELNKLYFQKYPINLQFLTEQRELKSFNSKNPFGV